MIVDSAGVMRYVLVTGGVISGVGKGIVSSSIGTILRSSGYHVTCIKIDPYLNIDAGTFSPYEHGEVYVLNDGAEVDLDLGNYERYLDITLQRDNNITTGRVYQRVIQKERNGDYLGKTVQVVPHVTDEIKDWVDKVAHLPTDGSGAIPEICIIELGGVISDIESLPFVEAFRQLLNDVGSNNFCCIHVSLIPQIGSELKTKPTQTSVWELRNKGLQADFLMSRSSLPLPEEIIAKLSRMCHVNKAQIFSIPDVPNLYQVPKMMYDLKIADLLMKHFKLVARPKPQNCLLDRWCEMLEHVSKTQYVARVGIVGKYTKLKDSYVSIIKAIEHAGAQLCCQVEIELVDSSELELPVSQNSLAAWKSLVKQDCVIIPGGFGSRSIQGKINAIQFCRQFGVPILGICLGFQMMVVEFCRNVLGLSKAHSTEIDPECEPAAVIDMPEHNTGEMGGTMRLGLHRTQLALSEKSQKFLAEHKLVKYKSAGEKRSVLESGDVSFSPDDSSLILTAANGCSTFDGRHRHRYEVNPELVDELESAGFAFVGRDSTGQRMEMGEMLLVVREQEKDCLECSVKDDEFASNTVQLKQKRKEWFNKRHPYFVGTQFHPEYLSRPIKPCALFVGLINAGMRSSQQQ